MRMFVSAWLMIISVNAFASGIEDQEVKILLRSLERIENKVDNVNNDISNLNSRVSSLESWREQSLINQARFYEKDWNSSVSDIKEIKSKITNLESEISKINGIVIAVIVFGSIISFLINTGITLFVSRKQGSTKNGK